MATKESSRKKIRLSRLNTRKSALLLWTVMLFIAGCGPAQNPYYPREQIPQEIIRLCQKEFNLAVTVFPVEDTLWVYIPMDRFVNTMGNVDASVMKNLNNVAMSINRVVLSTKNPPQFYVIAASDIHDVGADYITIGYTQDLKKYLYRYISREEFGRRYVHSFHRNPEALGDEKGTHIKPYNVYLPAFILAQIEERINLRFQEDDLKSFIDVTAIEATPEADTILFNFEIKDKGGSTQSNLDLTKEALKIIAQVFFNYDYKDFETVTIVDGLSGKRTSYSRKALEDFR